MKKTSSISDKTLDVIAKEKIRPIPRWEFVVKNWLLWVFLGIFTLVGSLGFSIVLVMLTSADWDIYSLNPETRLQKIIIYLPYFWLITTILFLTAAYLIWRKTKKAYRFDLRKMVTAEILISIMAGLVMFGMGVGEKVDEIFARDIPFYRTIAPRMLEVWMRPEEGLLAGEIVEVEPDNRVVIRDFKGKIWQVETGKALIRGMVRIEPGEQVKMAGVKISENGFEADQIRPWMGQGMRRRLKY